MLNYKIVTTESIAKNTAKVQSDLPSFVASLGLLIFTTFPSFLIMPESGLYNPNKILINVDFPAPFSPSKAKISAEAMCRTMKAGKAMMVFPEGTTSDGKDGLLPFKSTSFQAVIDSGTAVLPVVISYDEKCRSRLQWTGNTGFLNHAWDVLGLKKTEVTVYVLNLIQPLADEDRKAFAARVYDIMNQKWRSL